MSDIDSSNDESGITAMFRRIETERDDDACDRLWQKYFEQVVRIAQKRLRKLSSRDSSEDDVALSAMNSFFRAAEKGSLTSVKDRDCLWRVLATIAARKVRSHNRRNMSRKHGDGNVTVFSDIAANSPNPDAAGLPEFVEPGSDEEFAGQLFLEGEERLGTLPGDRLKRIAVLRMQGFELEEIALDVGLSRTAICNKLNLIRELWTNSSQDSSD